MKASYGAAFAAIGAVLFASLPALAGTDCPPGQIKKGDSTNWKCENVQAAPEPVTILGSIFIGASLLGKRYLNSRKTNL